MSDEKPAWIDQLQTGEVVEPSDPPPKVFPRKPKAKRSASSKKLFSPLQMIILAGLGLFFCLIMAGLAGVIFFNRDLLFGSPAPESAIAVEPGPPEAEATPARPAPSPTPPTTPTPFPTFALPETASTPEPTPTATYAVAPAFINKDKIREIARFVERWRELSLPEPLPIEFLTRDQLREQWQEAAYDQAAIEAVQTQEEFYRALGLIEPGVDLAQVAMDNQTSLVLGYYAPEEKVMYIIAESVNMFAQEEMTFAHEYVHALQDHYFNLEPFLNENLSADALLAARSLPEGDARLVEDLFTSENITQDQLDYTVYRYLFQEPPQIEGVSPALGIFTYFPYSAGEYFVIYLFLEGNYSWEMVNQAYRNPPVSTEQIMHPEKYLAGEQPVPVSLPDLAPALGEGWRELDRDVLGEAGFLVWLVDRVEEPVAIEGAAGWDGDAYSLWVNEAGQRVLAELSIWETEAEAIQFAGAFEATMELREGQPTQTEADAARFWQYEQGVTLLRQQGRQVLILVAPDRPVLDRVRGQFGGL